MSRPNQQSSRIPEVIKKAVAPVLVVAAIAGFAIEGARQSDRGSHRRLDAPTESVEESARWAQKNILELDNTEDLARTGVFKSTARQMETRAPYPLISKDGKKLGRILPYALSIPRYASADTRERIFRNGQHMTPAEAKAKAEFNNTTVSNEINNTVLVKASKAPDTSIYAANSREFERYRRLTNALTQAAKESIEPLGEDVQSSLATNRLAVRAFNRALIQDEDSYFSSTEVQGEARGRVNDAQDNLSWIIGSSK